MSKELYNITKGGFVGGLYPYDEEVEEQDHSIGAVAQQKKQVFYRQWLAYTNEDEMSRSHLPLEEALGGLYFSDL